MSEVSWPRLRWWALLGLLGGSGAWSAPAAGPAAHYAFTAATALGEDSSSAQRTATVTAARSGPGLVGPGLVLDGQGGLSVPGPLDLSGGFALELWVKFAVVTDSVNLASRDNQFLLRLDPVAEGLNLSFFVMVGQSLEPRVRTPRPQPDTWYHLVATWDGEYAALWVNGRQYRQARRGVLGESTAPVAVGSGSPWAPAGLRGTLDEVKLYTRPLADGEIIARIFGLDRPTGGPRATKTRWEFTRDTEGWESSDGSALRLTAGQLTGTVDAVGRALVNRALRVPLADKPFVSLHFALTGGSGEGRLAFLTTAGAGDRRFPVLADGQPHSYILRLDEVAEWDGDLLALALAPSETPATVHLDFVRVAAQPEAPPEIVIRNFLPMLAFNRAGRPCAVTATLHNRGGSGQALQARLTAPRGVQVVGAAGQTLATTDHEQSHELTWQVQSGSAQEVRLALEVTGPGVTPSRATLPLTFYPALAARKLPYLPDPEPAPTPYLIGAHHCPLWEADKPQMWTQILKHPERLPVLGYYNQENPEVADWETKWAVEHGINFFVYCWYRASQGGPVTTRFSSAIEQALFHSRFEQHFKWAIMWENQSRGTAGVADEQDLMTNLLPYWLDRYFKRDSYLKVDNKPLLFIYRPEYLIQDLGGVAQVQAAFAKMRQACRDAGFAGLYLLGEYRGLDRKHLALLQSLGLDYVFAYCWPVPNNPTPAQAIAAQMNYLQQTQALSPLPQVPTVSQAWSGWRDEGTIWKIPPREYEDLLRQAKDFMATLPADQLGRRMLLLDNWNEWGEGHYIAPYREYGFGYLDAVRRVFTTAPAAHVDLVPEDIGRGPYDTAIRTRLAQDRQLAARAAQRVVKPGGEAPDLVAWWSFDEAAEEPCALDYTGRGQGGILHRASRAAGWKGQALLCAGGDVTIPREVFRSPTRALTLACWVKTDTPDQSDKWFVNCIYGTGEAGFRLGLSGGRLTWAIPKTGWSHHLIANVALPLGEWVHVAATYDGQNLRLYQDGREVGVMARTGRLHPADGPLCLGNYDSGHRAHFTGLLDEVKVYSRALSAEEVAKRARR